MSSIIPEWMKFPMGDQTASWTDKVRAADTTNAMDNLIYRTAELEAARKTGWRSNPETRMNMIRSRLQLNTLPFHHLSTAVPESSSKVFVYILYKEDALILEDDPELFPSDALVTKLRLLMD